MFAKYVKFRNSEDTNTYNKSKKEEYVWGKYQLWQSNLYLDLSTSEYKYPPVAYLCEVILPVLVRFVFQKSLVWRQHSVLKIPFWTEMLNNEKMDSSERPRETCFSKSFKNSTRTIIVFFLSHRLIFLPFSAFLTMVLSSPWASALWVERGFIFL